MAAFMQQFFLAFAKTQYAGDTASENIDLSFDIHYTCFNDIGYPPPEKKGAIPINEGSI